MISSPLASLTLAHTCRVDVASKAELTPESWTPRRPQLEQIHEQQKPDAIETYRSGELGLKTAELHGVASQLGTLAPMKFEITYIFEKQRPVTLFARLLGAGEFSLSESPMLGGVPIKRYASQPRSVTPDGKPDLSQFSFVLSSANDLPKLGVGQIVELT